MKQYTNLVNARRHSNHNTPSKHLAILAQHLLCLQLRLVMNVYPVAISSHLQSTAQHHYERHIVIQVQFSMSKLAPEN